MPATCVLSCPHDCWTDLSSFMTSAQGTWGKFSWMPWLGVRTSGSWGRPLSWDCSGSWGRSFQTQMVGLLELASHSRSRVNLTQILPWHQRNPLSQAPLSKLKQLILRPRISWMKSWFGRLWDSSVGWGSGFTARPLGVGAGVLSFAGCRGCPSGLECWTALTCGSSFGAGSDTTSALFTCLFFVWALMLDGPGKRRMMVACSASVLSKGEKICSFSRGRVQDWHNRRLLIKSEVYGLTPGELSGVVWRFSKHLAECSWT